MKYDAFVQNRNVREVSTFGKTYFRIPNVQMYKNTKMKKLEKTKKYNS